MQGGQHEMAGERCLYGDLRGLEVADLANHDDVGILPQDGAQQAGEAEADLRLDLDLVDPGKMVFDRVLDRYDLACDRVELQKARVERCRLTAAGRTGDQDHAVWQIERMLDAVSNAGGKTEP